MKCKDHSKQADSNNKRLWEIPRTELFGLTWMRSRNCFCVGFMLLCDKTPTKSKNKEAWVFSPPTGHIPLLREVRVQELKAETMEECCFMAHSQAHAY